MIPIWAKDVDGNWQVFPAHLLDTFEDGKQGFSFELSSAFHGRRTHAFMQFRHCFEDHPRENPGNRTLLRFRYYLKEKL